MCEEFEPYFPVVILLGCSGFGDSFGCVDYAASNNIQEVISLGSGLMWNYDAVYGGKMDLKIIARDLYERGKSFESEYAIMFLVPLIFRSIGTPH